MIHTELELKTIAALLHEKATEQQSKELFALYFKTRDMIENYDKHQNDYYVYSELSIKGSKQRRKIFGPKSKSECFAYMNSLKKSPYEKLIVDKK